MNNSNQHDGAGDCSSTAAPLTPNKRGHKMNSAIEATPVFESFYGTIHPTTITAGSLTVTTAELNRQFNA